MLEAPRAIADRPIAGPECAWVGCQGRSMCKTSAPFAGGRIGFAKWSSHSRKLEQPERHRVRAKLLRARGHGGSRMGDSIRDSRGPRGGRFWLN